MEKFFNSKFPILEALMNGCSDLKLALAVQDAGAFPSLWFPLNPDDPEYHGISDDDRRELLHSTIQEFIKCTGSRDVLIRLNLSELLDPVIVKIILELKPSHIELWRLGVEATGELRMQKVEKDPMVLLAARTLSRNSKILLKIYSPCGSGETGVISGFCTKGAGSAGRFSPLHTRDFLIQQRQLTPTHAVIPHGGVGTAQQVKEYLDLGATAVAVGTLFAACKESRLSQEAKNAMVSARKQDLIVFEDSQRRALFFGGIDQTEQHYNRPMSLNAGITGDASKGHIYVGEAIDYITQIRTAKEVVEYLVSEL